MFARFSMPGDKGHCLQVDRCWTRFVWLQKAGLRTDVELQETAGQ